MTALTQVEYETRRFALEAAIEHVGPEIFDADIVVSTAEIFTSFLLGQTPKDA